MDLAKIKSILLTNDGIITEVEKRALIIVVIAQDEKAIPDILDILRSERSYKKNLISEFNTLLSKADAALDSPKLNKDKFIQAEVKDFYIKHKDFVTHNWKKY